MTTSEFVEDTQKLAKEVEEHFHAIAKLRQRMNALIPVVRLPPEILGHIFLWYIMVMVSDRDLDYYPTYHHRWLIITRVCHRWREVALRTPNLWTDIRLGQGSVDRVLVFMTRAKHAPLQIKASMGSTDNKWIPAFYQIASEFGHVETLDLTVSPETMKLLTDSIPSSAPLLRSVAITNYPHPFKPLALPKFLTTACSTPRLEELKVVNYNFNWSESILPRSLTHLCISRAGFSPTSPCSDFVAVIRALPSLQHLELNHVFIPLPVTTRLPPISLSVSLPKLSCITLAGSALDCSHFLDHCTIPASARISLSFQNSCTRNVIPLIMPVLSAKLSTRIAHDDKEPVESLFIGGGSIEFVKRGLSAAPNRSHLHIEVSYSTIVNGDGSMLAGLCSLPIRDVSALTVTGIPHGPTVGPALLTLFKALTKINTLSILFKLTSPRGIIALLQTRLEKADKQKGKHIFPNLKHILLQELRFRDLYEETDTFVADLCAALKARRKSRCKVETLTIKKCLNMDEDDVAQLEKVVEVVWDGEVEFEEDEEEDRSSLEDGYSSYYDPYYY